jgi:hypothetical protein
MFTLGAVCSPEVASIGPEVGCLVARVYYYKIPPSIVYTDKKKLGQFSLIIYDILEAEALADSL